jgi:hypothetical protein
VDATSESDSEGDEDAAEEDAIFAQAGEIEELATPGAAKAAVAAGKGKKVGGRRGRGGRHVTNSSDWTTTTDQTET